MPIYEYRCTSCGHELEALQKFTESPLVNCPSCRADALTKLVSLAGFQLKGTGWYATDFRNGSKPAPKPDSKGDGKTEGPKAEGAKTDGAKTEGAKTEGAKTDGAKTEGAKTEAKSESKAEASSTSPG
jgi:putative FmdB family regulatory protein